MAENYAVSASDVLPLGFTPEAEQVHGVKTRLAQLCTRDDELTAERDAVRAEMVSAKDKLDTLVNAPVRGGRDPTLWLPDELMVMIFVVVPFEVLWSGECERVCQRWRRIVREGSLVQRRKREERWASYNAGVIKPRVLEGHTWQVSSLAVGLDGKIYSGSDDRTIRVWSGVDGTHLQTLEGHTEGVTSLAVGLDGRIFSGSYDRTIRVWSGVDGVCLQTLEGHIGGVFALAVGLDGNIYSGSGDKRSECGLVWMVSICAHSRGTPGLCNLLQWGRMARSTLDYMTARSECGRVWMAHTYRRLKDTSTVSTLLQWGWTGGSTLDRLTTQSECGRMWIADTCRRSKDTLTLSSLLQWGWTGRSTLDHLTARSECGRVWMAHACRRSKDTPTASTLSQWVWTAGSILDQKTARSECGDGDAHTSRR